MPGGCRSHPNDGHTAQSDKRGEPKPGRQLFMHRIIMETPPHFVCDHIDRINEVTRSEIQRDGCPAAPRVLTDEE